jgi:hypothetical protein
VLSVCIAQAAAQYYYTDKTPQRIILNLTPAPATSIAVTWRTAAEVKNPAVQIAQATDWTEFAVHAKESPAKTELFMPENKQPAWYYSTLIKGLEPNTLYAYRVGGDSVWSEWNQFATASSAPAPFTFVYMGDPQNDIMEHVSRVFREAYKFVPDARFWLFTGDMTTEPTDKLADELFGAAGFIWRTTPVIMAPGNHDCKLLKKDGVFALDKRGWKIQTKTISDIWRPEFTLPENGIPGLEETSYYLDYEGVRFIVINSNDKLSEQAEWMEKLLLDNPCKWTVAAFHHPIYSAGKDRDDHDTRDAFLPLFDKYHVDLVLTGHDHAYARSYKLRDGKRAGDTEQGTVYVVSVCGPKAYGFSPRYADLMAKSGEHISLFQKIAIDGSTLKFTTYTATGAIYDSFELKK